MNDTDTVKILSEIRDEMKEMNSRIKWLTDKVNEEIAKDENHEKSRLKIAEMENRKSKKDLFTVIIVALGFVVWLALEKLGYL